MSMRGPLSDLPVMLEEVGIIAGEVTILNGISLTIAPGAPTVLIGPNGSGKTTLLRAAMGLIPVTRGRITWGGQEASPPDRRAILFQRPVMLRRSAAGNIGYALAAAGVPRADRSARTAELIVMVGLQGLARRPARRLSGGEQQRVAIARALITRPSVLLADEPTGDLDEQNAWAVFGLLERLHRTHCLTSLIATHNAALAERCDRVVGLEHGILQTRSVKSVAGCTPGGESS